MLLLKETKETLGYESSDMDGCLDGELLSPHPTLVGVFLGTTSQQVTTVGRATEVDIDGDAMIDRFGEETANRMAGCLPWGTREGMKLDRDEDGNVRIRTPYVVHKVPKFDAECVHRWESDSRFEAVVAELETLMEKREIVFGAFENSEMAFSISRDRKTDEVTSNKGKVEDGNTATSHAKAVRGFH
jgi:hypothetical protein